MRLVIGGRAAGKLNYVLRDTGLSPEDVADGRLEEKPVLNHFHLLVKRMLEQGGNVDTAVDTLIASDRVVICDEVGCGVVPTDAAERRFRDETGRACQRLAAGAVRVDRVICGIAMTIKGERV